MDHKRKNLSEHILQPEKGLVTSSRSILCIINNTYKKRTGSETKMK